MALIVIYTENSIRGCDRDFQGGTLDRNVMLTRIKGDSAQTNHNLNPQR